MLIVDEERSIVKVVENGVERQYPFASYEAFSEVSKCLLRIGWDTKYVYSFRWLGRPIIQLPEDILTIQEIIYDVKPDVIIEIGVAHGGSLMLYASICKAIGKGKVIGVDIEIRKHNREAIEEHELYDFITLIEGDSVADDTYAAVKSLISENDTVMVLLDGKHTKEHVSAELKMYAPLVTKNSYIVAMDGIQKDLVGAPRSQDDWEWNNPAEAALEFVDNNEDYQIIDFVASFNEGMVMHRPTYWPSSFIKRV